VVTNVHTDAIAAYLDDGTLVAQSKADIDIDGDGKIDLGTRLVSREVLFHLGDVAKTTVPNLPGLGFLGAPGSTIWMAPIVQDPRIIWPGFSTEDPNLRGKADSLDVRLVGVEGPGKAEVFMAADNRIFSSTTQLPAWRIGVPQHTHMNWAFTKPGTYTFTFELSGRVDGRQQTARNDYTFVVGDLAAHTRQSSVSLQASSTSVEQGEQVMFTAAVAPAGAAGAVQFWDLSSGMLLGHTPVADGKAQFLAEALNPGTRRIVADFVPTWSTDVEASTSASVNIAVGGEEQHRPGHTDTQPVPDSTLTAHTPGSVVEITSAGRRVVAGATVTARVKDGALAGHWLSVWLPGQSPAWRGWVQADQAGAFSIDLEGARVRSQQLVVKDAAGAFVGWDRFDIGRPLVSGGGAGSGTGGGSGGGGGSGTSSGGGSGSGGGNGSGAGSSSGSRAPGARNCQPAVTLDHGHIDAFYVSAANGRAVLQLMEDVTGYHVIRDAETVLLKVNQSARGTVAGAPPGTPASGYVLPLTQRSDLIWPGWDTNRTSASGYSDVSISVTNVSGPGTVSLYTQGDWGAWASLLTNGGYRLPGTFREPRPVHTHAQWVFSEKGVYKLTVRAVATNPKTGKSLTTSSHTYVFQVGDGPLGDTFCTVKPHGRADAAQVNAAVDKATKDALTKAKAAEQAKAKAAEQAKAKQEAEKRKAAERTKQESGSGEDGAGALDEILGGGGAGNQTLLVGLVGMGSGLLISGIAGGTVWYVRRLRRMTAAAEQAT
jgi:surface-anchored protein